MPITIRSLAPDEYLETSRITLECMRADYTFLPAAYRDSLTLEEEVSQFSAWAAEEGTDAVVLGAFEGGKMVGYIAVSNSAGEPSGYDGEVNNLFVRREHRGRGIGLLLLEQGLRILRERGHRMVIIYNYRPSASNGFYRALGGEVAHRSVQHPDGTFAVDVDVFAWPIDQFLETLSHRLELSKHLRV